MTFLSLTLVGAAYMAVQGFKAFTHKFSNMFIIYRVI